MGRTPFLLIRHLWGKGGKDPWITRLAVIVLCLALILFFLQFLKSPEKTSETGTSTAPPEIRQDSGPVEETQPLHAPQEPVAPVPPEKNPAAEIKATKTDSGVEAADDPIPHKGKYSFLKSKTKTLDPDIKPKE